MNTGWRDKLKNRNKGLPTYEDMRGIFPLTERTAPTQAQIEAARKAYYKADDEVHDDDRAWRAALTAAAEVGE